MGSSIGGLVGGIAGSVIPGLGTGIGAALGSGIGGLLGGSSQGGSAARASGAAGSSIYGAGQQAQQMAQFRPVGVTTGFGQSRFGFDPSGQLTSAGYTLDPRLQGIQGRVLSQAEQYRPEDIAAAAQPLMGGAQSLFGLGQQYLAESPQAAAQRYISQQQGLLAPMRAAEEARLATANFGRGTGGLGVQTGTGSAPSNPLAQALFNARAQQDLQLASQAQQEAQKQIAFGSGLFQQGGGLLGQVPALTTAGYSPLQTQLGLASTTEAMGQQAMDIGSALGARQSTAGASAGQLGLLGARGAAPYQVEQQSYNPLAQVLGGTSGQLGQAGGQIGQVGGQIGNWFGDLIGNPMTAFRYGTNRGSEQTRMLAEQERGFY
jgi:hypothetical protein